MKKRKSWLKKMKKIILSVRRKKKKLILFKRRKAKRKPKIKEDVFKNKSVQKNVAFKSVSSFQENSKSRIEEEKFSTPSIEYTPLKEELPSSYGKDKLVLMVRDPWWVFCYWELTPQKIEEVKRELGIENKFYFALRVYEITNIIFTGSNANYYFDIPINLDAKNWYINLPAEGKSWIVDLGIKGDFGFKTILRSNPVNCPRSTPSEILDEEWMIPEEEFLKLYAASVGVRGTSPVGKEIFKERFLAEFPSAGFSPGFSVGFFKELLKKEEKKFFLEVWTELIVYGRTEPDAKVYIKDAKIPLREDGTFSARFFLPDGKQIIKVKAISSDNTQQKQITPIVTKETK